MYGAIDEVHAGPGELRTRSRLRRVAGAALATAAFLLSAASLNARERPESPQLSATDRERSAVFPIAIHTDAFRCLDADQGPVLDGYDAVSYWSGTPLRGKPGLNATLGRYTFFFASAENRDTFSADPLHFAPQYSGFCAFSVVYEYWFGADEWPVGDPESWVIIHDKLFVFLNDGARTMFLNPPIDFNQVVVHQKQDMREAIEFGNLRMELANPLSPPAAPLYTTAYFTCRCDGSNCK